MAKTNRESIPILSTYLYECIGFLDNWHRAGYFSTTLRKETALHLRSTKPVFLYSPSINIAIMQIPSVYDPRPRFSRHYRKFGKVSTLESFPCIFAELSSALLIY